MQTARIDKTKNWTVEDYLLLGEMTTPCQLINGELIMSPAPTPYHQQVLSNLNDFLKTAAKEAGGRVYFSPIDLFINEKNVVQPDLLFLSKGKLSFVKRRGIDGAPDLIVEILSPSNIFTDRNTKMEKYFEFGVDEFWIIDPGNKTLEIYLRGQSNPAVPYLYLAEEGKVTSTVLKNMEFDLKEIFN